MALNDQEISWRCGLGPRNDAKYDYYRSNPMLDPFVAEKTKKGALSYGVGHFGYDIRLGYSVKVPRVSTQCGWIDPLEPETLSRQKFFNVSLEEVQHALKPGEFILAGTFEYFRMPSDLVATVHDKSTLARLGVAVQTTVLEPGWSGYLTMEITNHGVNTIMLSARMPIAQVIFHQGNIPNQLYDGKYQNQAYAEIARAD